MTESDERAIYEWAMPELKGDDWKIYGDLDDCGTYRLDAAREGKPLLPLPRLDMNFAFDVCIPKLKQERAQVMYDNMGSNEWWIDPPDRARTVLTYTDFYPALLAYIKGAK